MEADEVSRSLLKISRPLVIEHGTRAAIFTAGKYQGEIPAGRYDMAGDLPGFFKAINFFTGDQRVVAILTDAGVFGLNIGPYLAETSDGEQVKLAGRIVLRVRDVDALVVNTMKGARRVIIGDGGRPPADGQTVSLSHRLADELRMCISGLVRRSAVEELDDAWWASDDFGNRLDAASGRGLREMGLELVRVEHLTIDNERLNYKKQQQKTLRHDVDDINFNAGASQAIRDATRTGDRAALSGDREDGALDHDRRRLHAEEGLKEKAATNREAEQARVLDHQRNRVTVAGEADAAAIATERVDVEKSRAAVAQALRRIAADGQLDVIQTDSELQEAIRKAAQDAGLRNVIRDDEMNRLKERFAHERDLTKIAGRIEVEGITDKAAKERAWDALLDDERRRDETRQREAARSLAATHDQLERRRIELELKQLDHEQQLGQRERDAHLAVRLREQELGLQEKGDDLQFRKAQRANELLSQAKRIEREEDDAHHQRDLERATAERTDRLEQMRLKAGLTPDQILAMTAEQSPAAAEALAERYRADGRLSREREQLLREQLDEQRRRESAERERGERTVQQQRESAAQATDQLIRLMSDQRGVVQSALEQMGQVAATRAQAPAPSTTVAYPPAGGFGVSAALPPARPAVVYHVVVDNRQAGPYEFETLRTYINNGQVNRSTLVWRDGMSQWQSADQVAELATMFKPNAPPPPLPL